VIDLKTLRGKRDFTLFYLLYSIAARIDEILSLKISDIHLTESNGKNYLVVTGKEAKRRTPPILNNVAKVLRGYIARFHDKNPNHQDFLFFSNYEEKNKKLTQEAINKRLKIVCIQGK
jgi:site-specific recombinase XerD